MVFYTVQDACQPAMRHWVCVWQASLYKMLLKITWNTGRWMSSTVFFCSFVRKECQAGQAYSRSDNCLIIVNKIFNWNARVLQFCQKRQSFHSFWHNSIDMIFPLQSQIDCDTKSLYIDACSAVTDAIRSCEWRYWFLTQWTKHHLSHCFTACVHQINLGPLDHSSTAAERVALISATVILSTNLCVS